MIKNNINFSTNETMTSNSFFSTYYYKATFHHYTNLNEIGFTNINILGLNSLD
jgi:hypothetical protein